MSSRENPISPKIRVERLTTMQEKDGQTDAASDDLRITEKRLGEIREKIVLDSPEAPQKPATLSKDMTVAQQLIQNIKEDMANAEQKLEQFFEKFNEKFNQQIAHNDELIKQISSLEELLAQKDQEIMTLNKQTDLMSDEQLILQQNEFENSKKELEL